MASQLGSQELVIRGLGRGTHFVAAGYGVATTFSGSKIRRSRNGTRILATSSPDTEAGVVALAISKPAAAGNVHAAMPASVPGLCHKWSAFCLFLPHHDQMFRDVGGCWG